MPLILMLRYKKFMNDVKKIIFLNIKFLLHKSMFLHFVVEIILELLGTLKVFGVG